METKMITIPFDVERAKLIQAGEEPGKIVTRAGRNARVVCWDRHDDTYPIIALFWNEERINEVCKSYMNNGCFFENGEENQYDLTLQVPEWTQFKDGDILVTKKGSSFILNANGEYRTSSYASLLSGKLSFGGSVLGDYIEVITYATEEQKQQLIDALKASTDPRAKEYLKRFFGIEEKQECEFEPFQQVLVRDDCKRRWICALFNFYDRRKETSYSFVCIGGSFRYCIPYNDQTKHLLGTTDDWEEEECKR